MYKLFCLVGKSNTGKDTLANSLLRMPELKLSRLVLYTTRPRRPLEKKGEAYHFVSPQMLDALIRKHGMIERRDYQTAKGLWSYCTLPDKDMQAHRIAVTPLPALRAYREHFGVQRVVPLYIEVPDRERLLRAVTREAHHAAPCYTEVCRRFLSDELDFSQENLLSAGITRSFENLDLSDCLSELAAEVRRQIRE